MTFCYSQWQVTVVLLEVVHAQAIHTHICIFIYSPFNLLNTGITQLNRPDDCGTRKSTVSRIWWEAKTSKDKNAALQNINAVCGLKPHLSFKSPLTCWVHMTFASASNSCQTNTNWAMSHKFLQKLAMSHILWSLNHPSLTSK